MVDHWYLCADCKTPGCRELMLFRYLGAFDPAGKPPRFEITWIPQEFECKACHQKRLFLLADTQCRKLPFPPTKPHES